jgi:hypothetical protein
MFSTTPGLVTTYLKKKCFLSFYDVVISFGLYDADISTYLYDASFLSLSLWHSSKLRSLWRELRRVLTKIRVLEPFYEIIFTKWDHFYEIRAFLHLTSASAFFTSELCRNNKTDMACFDEFGEAIMTSILEKYWWSRSPVVSSQNSNYSEQVWRVKSLAKN